ncbi:MAG: hypothetical protein EOO08_12305 [Chitinophagaceae bacterium]|nr:MAG: hypothetical protein EOO08_12305 [Chitinophagaceae bacterium]
MPSVGGSRHCVPETLHSTDPQKHMRGPVSGRVNEVDKLMHKPGNTEPRFPDERYPEGADLWQESDSYLLEKNIGMRRWFFCADSGRSYCSVYLIVHDS